MNHYEGPPASGAVSPNDGNVEKPGAVSDRGRVSTDPGGEEPIRGRGARGSSVD